MGVVEKKMDITLVYWGHIGMMEQKMENVVVPQKLETGPLNSCLWLVGNNVREITYRYVCGYSLLKSPGFFRPKQLWPNHENGHGTRLYDFASIHGRTMRTSC